MGMVIVKGDPSNYNAMERIAIEQAGVFVHDIAGAGEWGLRLMVVGDDEGRAHGLVTVVDDFNPDADGEGGVCPHGQRRDQLAIVSFNDGPAGGGVRSIAFATCAESVLEQNVGPFFEATVQEYFAEAAADPALADACSLWQPIDGRGPSGPSRN